RRAVGARHLRGERLFAGTAAKGDRVPAIRAVSGAGDLDRLAGGSAVELSVQRSGVGAHSSARERARAISPRVIWVATPSRIRARASRARGGAAAADKLSHLPASTISRGTPKPL